MEGIDRTTPLAQDGLPQHTLAAKTGLLRRDDACFERGTMQCPSLYSMRTDSNEANAALALLLP